MDVEGSRVWFTDLWNYSLVPYLLEAVREGLQVGCGKNKKNSLTASSLVERVVHEVVFIHSREELSFLKAGKPQMGSDELVKNKALERCDSRAVGRRQVEIEQSKKAEAGERLQKTICLARLGGFRPLF